MKKLIIIAVALTSAQALYGQLNTAWPANVSTATPAGYVGIGTKPTTTHVNPNFNLHLHGTTDYLGGVINDNPTGIIPIVTDGEIQQSNGMVTKSTINFGKTTRFGMTNSTTGSTLNDGVVFRMSDNNFSIFNREAGNFSMGVPNVSMTLSSATQRIWMGGSTFSTSAMYASLNVIKPSDNGMYVQGGNGKYGLRVRTINNSDDALQVFGANSTIKNFKVSGAGEVFARRYTTTLNNIPDYVFEPNYKLLTLDELRSYITTNKHLPNVPSANEFAETGVDLGELNRLLLEKVEELTLYILQLEERTKRLEDQK
jgi:hypothetical protein